MSGTLATLEMVPTVPTRPCAFRLAAHASVPRMRWLLLRVLLSLMPARRGQQQPGGGSLFAPRRMQVLTLRHSRGARMVWRRTCGMSFQWKRVKAMARMTRPWLWLSLFYHCIPIRPPHPDPSCLLVFNSALLDADHLVGHLQVTVSMSVGNGQGQLERTIAATVLPAVAHQALLASAILRGDTVCPRAQHSICTCVRTDGTDAFGKEHGLLSRTRLCFVGCERLCELRTNTHVYACTCTRARRPQVLLRGTPDSVQCECKLPVTYILVSAASDGPMPVNGRVGRRGLPSHRAWLAR